MRKKLRKTTSVYLAVIIMLGVLTIAPISVSAAGNTANTATSYTMGNTVYGSITDSNTKDYYKFTLSTSGKITLNVTAYIYRSYYNIYDSNLNQVWASGKKNWNSATEVMTLSEEIYLTSGTYYFMVEKYYTDTGNYNFKMNFASSGESFKETTGGTNNSFSSANSISLNTKYNGQIAVNDDKDFYKFTLSSSRKITLNVTAYIYRSYYHIYNSSFNEVWSSNRRYWNDSSKSMIMNEDVSLSSGTYYFMVEKYYSDTGDYNFTLSSTTAPTSVSVSPSSLSLNVGNSYTLTKSVYPSNASTSYTWSSSNTSVATVDSNGKVTAKKAGTATITVKTSNGKTATCKVTVTKVLATPTITNLQNTADGIRISWNKVSGAYGYRLYYKYPGKDWKRFKDTTSTSFTDTGVSAGRTETYTIRCIDKDGNTISGYNSGGWSYKYEPVNPTITKLENTSDGIKISWNKIAGVYGYRLYYKYPGKDWKRFKDTTSTSFTDTGVSLGRTETYTIRCIDKNGNTVSGYNSGGWSQTYSLPNSIPQITKLENTSNGIKISWNKVAGVYGYRLYYKYPGKDWKRFKDTTATSFTDTGVSAGRTETYTIRCIDSNGNTFSGYNSDGWSKKYEPVAPTITKLEKASNGVKISWNPVAGVYGYRLYYKYPGQDWKRFKDTAGTSFTDTGVKSGRTETYTIRCIDKDGNTISGYNPNGWSITY